MKRLAILLSALLWLQTAASGAEPWFRYFSDGHAVIKQGSLYGFADRNGAEVIPCRYTKAYPFNDASPWCGRAMKSSPSTPWATASAHG